MRVLALDYGSARCGCALSDPTGTIVTPIEAVLRPGHPARARARSRELVREREVERVVVGLPLSLRGGDTEQTRETRAFARRSSHARLGDGVPVEMHDERFTTRIAQRDGRRRSHGERGLARRRPPAGELARRRDRVRVLSSLSRGNRSQPARERTAEERERDREERARRRAAAQGSRAGQLTRRPQPSAVARRRGAASGRAPLPPPAPGAAAPVEPPPPAEAPPPPAEVLPPAEQPRPVEEPPTAEQPLLVEAPRRR